MTKSFTRAMILSIILTMIPLSAVHGVIYVRWDAPGPIHDGASWETAYTTVQEGLDAATSTQDAVWVSAGTYVGQITIREGIRLYGGFAGSEESLEQRDWNVNLTILDGNQKGTVVTVPEYTTLATTIDGFTIRNGTGTYHDYGEDSGMWGGGVFGHRASITLVNSVVANNTAELGAGIAIVSDSKAEIINCVIAYNSGEPVSSTNSSSVAIRNTLVSNNSRGLVAQYGSGISVVDSEISNNGSVGFAYRWSGIGMRRTVITNNTHGININRSGGGVRDSLITGTDSSAVVAGYMSFCDVESSTIVDNAGTGVYFGDYGNTLVDSIVAFNHRGISTVPNSYPTVQGNCVYGNIDYDYSGIDMPESDISQDPLFANRELGNYRLTAGSPCINQASESELSIDLDGFIRPQDGSGDGLLRSDIGAYEYPTSLANAKAVYPDGHPIAFGGVAVTAEFPAWARIYAERPDRSCGIRIETGQDFSEGDMLNVYGSIHTDPYTGERFVAASSPWPEWIGRAAVPEPLGLVGRNLGGGSLGLQEGIVGSSGLNNIGLLVTIWGRVTASRQGWFYVDDGSGIQDGTGFTGVYVAAPNMHQPAPGSHVFVTGISSCELYNEQMVHVLLPRCQGDIRIVGEHTAVPAPSTADADPRASGRRLPDNITW